MVASCPSWWTSSPCLAQIKGDLTDGALLCAPGSLEELKDQGVCNRLSLCDGQVGGSVCLGIAWLVADRGGFDVCLGKRRCCCGQQNCVCPFKWLI